MKDPGPRSQPFIKQPQTKLALHPRNAHRAPYDFPALMACYPPLAGYVATNAYGNLSVDFADSNAVKALNAALLKFFYRIDFWDIPAQFLCPPIPGRVDYLHYLADLLSHDKAAHDKGKNDNVRVLDVGVGANLIYPLLGQRVYGWHFVGAEVDAIALRSAQNIVDRNSGLESFIELRFQPVVTDIFVGVIRPGERFDLSLCNPPFHRSAEEAQAGSARKWRNLAKPSKRHSDTKQTRVGAQGAVKAPLNFGGKSHELWCEGGELLFLQRMIAQSANFAAQVRWFTSLVSKEDHLPKLFKALKTVSAASIEVIPMQQGQKQSRILAWSFCEEN